MLKKLIKMGVVMSFLMASIGAFAQNTGKAEYPRYGFWSNWSVGGSVDYVHELAQKEGLHWRRSTNAGMDIFVQHKLNHAFDTRFRLSMPTFWKNSVNGNAMMDEEGYKMTRYFTLSFNILGSINDMLLGYDPDRRFSIYFIAGAGVSINSLMNHDEQTGTRYDATAGGLGFWRPYLNAGLGMSYRFTDASTLFVEYALDADDIPDIFTADFYQWSYVHAVARLGYSYCFGVTAADQAVAAQKAMLTQENFGALNTQVTALEQQVASNNVDTKKLENRIAELEDQLAEALANQKNVNSAAADSLQEVINKIKADQLNYYGMPFSVQYGVDEWKVSDDEMEKVKAVARVMKDNSDVKIMVVGFADYTGSDAYNMKLSERRANEVKRLLVKKYGIAEDRITVDFKGKNAPFGDVQYALNRRVSFYRVIE